YPSSSLRVYVVLRRVIVREERQVHSDMTALLGAAEPAKPLAANLARLVLFQDRILVARRLRLAAHEVRAHVLDAARAVALPRIGHVLRPALEAQHAALGLAGATVAAVVWSGAVAHRLLS